MSLDVHARHRLASLLDRALSTPQRFGAACAGAGLKAPAPRGVEPGFSRVSAVLLASPSDDALAALVAAAAVSAPELAEALRAELAPEPEPEPEPEPDPDELATVRVLGKRHEAEDAPPRPAGTPAQAPSPEGATSWLVRRAHLSVPTTVRPGEVFDVGLTLVEPGAGAVPGAPADATPWEGEASVDWEMWLEEAFPAAEGATLSGAMTVGADARPEVTARIRAADPLADGVDVMVRFFLAGYEVGRARAFVPNGARDDVEPRPAAPGALAVPDTILS